VVVNGRIAGVAEGDLTCPRCGRPAVPDEAEPSGLAEPRRRWRCPIHGDIDPLWRLADNSDAGLSELTGACAVPVLAPWPIPAGWLVSGFAAVGREHGRVRASVVALSGPNPVGGAAEMLLICEEPGIGLGAASAGLPGTDPGDDFAACSPQAQVELGHHELPLWHVDAAGCAAFAGELLGRWLWILLWPDTAGTLLVEPLPLVDLRDPGCQPNLPFGTRSPRLPG